MRRSTARKEIQTAHDATVAIREAERRDIARELHDTVIQPLSALVIGLEASLAAPAQPLTLGMIEAYATAWKGLAREALDALRATLAGIHDEHPHARLGLPDALRTYVAPQARSRGLRLTLLDDGWPDDLPLDRTTGLYLLVREVLTNIERHAHATEATVLLQCDVEQLRVIITDNGVGFAGDAVARARAAADGGGHGIAGMHERVRRLGGWLTITTGPASGACVELAVPWRRDGETYTPPVSRVKEDLVIPAQTGARRAKRRIQPGGVA